MHPIVHPIEMKSQLTSHVRVGSSPEMANPSPSVPSAEADVMEVGARLTRCVDETLRSFLDTMGAQKAEWQSEREELLRRVASLAGDNEALDARCADLEERNMSLQAQLRSAEAAGAMSAAETRKVRAELDEVRDSVEGRREALRAEMEMWKESSKKYRKRCEHAEHALQRLKSRVTAGGGGGGGGGGGNGTSNGGGFGSVTAGPIHQTSRTTTTTTTQPRK